MHKVLRQQLKQSHLSKESLPNQLAQWQALLALIDKAYKGHKNDTSLLAPYHLSPETFIKRDNESNYSTVTGVGYWHYDKKTAKVTWSNSLFKLFHLNTNKAPPSYEEFMKCVHPTDRPQFEELIHNALEKQLDYRYDFRFSISGEPYKWFRAIGHCQKKEEQLAGIVLDIERDKEIEQKMDELNQRLLISARRAGMAEVATSILHNIGNILNSCNVSANLLKENLAKPLYSKLSQVSQLLQDNKENVTDYLMHHERGQLIPDYLMALAALLTEEVKKNNTEIDHLIKNIQHINDIVSRQQQTISGISGIVEENYLPDLVDMALDMSLNFPENRDIIVVKKYTNCPVIVSDKSKLLQILINLLTNAKDSLLKTSNPKKMIRITIDTDALGKLCLKITDNGEGIAPTHLPHIFSFGFTTKINGHGFGLHSCVLSVQELGGAIRVESLGIGKGATFYVTLPLTNTGREQGVFNEE